MDYRYFLKKKKKKKKALENMTKTSLSFNFSASKIEITLSLIFDTLTLRKVISAILRWEAGEGMLRQCDVSGPS